MNIKHLLFYLFMCHSIILPLPVYVFFSSNNKITIGGIIVAVILLIVIEFLMFCLQDAWKAFLNCIFIISPLFFSAGIISYLTSEYIIPSNYSLYFFLLPIGAFCIFSYYQVKENERYWITYIGGFISWLTYFIILMVIPSKFREFPVVLASTLYFLYLWGLLGVNFYLSAKTEDYLP